MLPLDYITLTTSLRQGRNREKLSESERSGDGVPQAATSWRQPNRFVVRQPAD